MAVYSGPVPNRPRRRCVGDLEDDPVAVPILIGEGEQDVELLVRKRGCPVSGSHKCIYGRCI